jgi:type II secretory ATPase GspE/PulE/Tfp pilus assembly ATPase PilB-like protein
MSDQPTNEYDVEFDIPPSSLLPEMVNDLIAQAVTENATDMHVDPVRGEYVLRFRVDGLIHEKGKLTRAEGRRLVNQIKVASRLDIERIYMPIEGQFRWGNEQDGRDIRVTMVPTLGLEALHMRLLVRPDESRDVEQLGMSGADRENVLTALRHPHGLVLVSGVTGAGKTTTLYAMARTRHLAGRVIMSIEDPVEFDLDYVRQLQVDEERGLTMAAGLRVLLRMDPDVLLVGEVRDTPSAITAARAAQAGRLVMATIHARDAAAALDTLQYLSVPDYVVGGALRLIVSQNLVRRL